MAHRAKPVVTTAPIRSFADLLAAPFATIGDLLSAVIAANGRPIEPH